MNFGAVYSSFLALVHGVPLTLALVLSSLAIGLVIACLIAAARLSSSRLLSAPAFLYTYVFRGTPLLLQIFIVYYGLGSIDAIRTSFAWPVLRDDFFCAVIALSLNSAAYASEIIRGGILAVNFGQIEAANAFGFNRRQRLWRIVIPQVLRYVLPAYGNEMIIMVKASALASTITLMEVTGIARNLAAKTYTPIETFAAAGLIYLAINMAIVQLVRLVDSRSRLARIDAAGDYGWAARW